jgi:AbrB family looped-hinge helix DNA binding protein
VSQPKLTTVLSTKGQMVLPKAVRDRRGWGEGVRLVVEDTPQGVLLKAEDAEPLFPPTRMEDVVGVLKRPGQRPASDEDIRRAARQGAAERYQRGLRKS